MPKMLLWIIRLVVGIVFIFSGVVKSVDAWGLAYKLQEYFEVFHLTDLNFSAPVLAMLFNTLEVVLGVAIIIGAWPLLTTYLLLGLIVFFTFLTGYSAIFDAVKDCGCFGDAIQLTPEQSFAKDVVLMVLIWGLWKNRHQIRPLGQWVQMVMLLTIIVTSAVNYYSYACLPIMDFRPYKVGNNVLQLMEIPPGAPVDEYRTTLVYRHKASGKTQEFTLDAIPTDTMWEWVETRNKLVKKGYTPPVHDFFITSADGEDVTSSFLELSGWKAMVVLRDPEKLSNRKLEKVEKLVVGLESIPQRPIKVWVVTSAGPERWVRFESKFRFYFMDETTLKTMIRANPGLILWKEGTIKGKWSMCGWPSPDELLQMINQNQ